MANRYEQIIANVRSMVEQNAPPYHIDSYLAGEGLTPAQFRKLAAGSTIAGQAKEFFKGIPSGAVGLLETAGVGAAAALPEEYEEPTRKFIQEKGAALRRPFAPEIGYEETIPRKFGEAVGSTGPFFALGPLGAVGRVAQVGLGVGAGAGEARLAAEEKGVTGDDRALATALGAPVGLLDLIAPEIKYGKQLITRAAITGGVEGATEAAQKISQNLIAKGIYNPEQPILAGAGEEGAYGAGAGALTRFLMDAALGRRARGDTGITTPPTAPAAAAPVGVPAEARQLPLGQVPELGEGYEGFRAPPEPYRAAEEKEAERQNRLFQITELRDQHDVLMREVDRLKTQFEAAPTDEQKSAILERANELNTARADLETQIKQLSKGLEGAERAGAVAEPGQMGLDFEAPAMPRQRTGEGVVLGEEEAAPAGITPEQSEFFRQQRIADINARMNAGEMVTDAERAFLQMDAREQRAAFEARPTPELVVPEERDQFRLGPQYIQPAPTMAEAVETRPVTEADFKAMGVGKTNKKLREAIMGKDLADPEQRAEVQEVLTDFANDPNRSPKLIEGVNNFLSSPVFMEQGELDLRPRRKPRTKKAKEAADVIQPTESIESAVEPSTAMADELGTAPPGRVTAPIAGGVDVTGGVTQQPDVGAGVQPTALEGAPADVTPAAPPTGGALALPAPAAGGAAAPTAPAAPPLLPPTAPDAGTALATMQAAPTATTPAVETEAVPEGAGVPAVAEGRISAGDAISRMVFNGYTRKEAMDYLRNVVDPYNNTVALEDLSNVIDGQFRVIEEGTLAPAVLQLASPEQQALADHYGAPVNSPQFLAKLREDIHNYVTKGAQAVDKAIRSIIKKLQSAVLAVAVIMNPNYMSTPFPVAVPKTTVTYEQVQATVPAEVRESLSPAAQQAYATIFPAIQADLKAKNKLFVLTDKPNARVVIFTADGKPVLDKKVLLGKTMGDFYKGNTDVVSNRVTPAGLFNLGLRDAAKGGGEAKTAGAYDFGKVFVLDKAIDGEYSVTLFHSVWTKEKDAQQRLAALKKEGAEDSRYSFGCINVDKESYKFLLDNYGQQMNGAKMFVVPDTPGAVMDFINGKAVAAGDIKREAVQPKVEKVTKTEPSAPAPAETRAEEAIRPEDRLAGKGAKPLYRTIEGTGEGMPKSKVEAIVKDAISRWKNAPNTQVVQDIQELPQELYQQMVRDNAFDAPGIFDPTTQTVFLIADNIPNAKEAVLTLTHEALGHFGIQSILGNTYGKVMDDIYNGNAKVRELAQKKMETGLEKRTAVEEVLADMAEKGVYNNAIQRIFNAIRQFFRKIGLTKAVTDAEVREVLANAQRFVVAGGPRTEGTAAFKGKPLYRAGTDAFKKWFGNSVVRNPDGSPKLMYHGTARDISEFRPKQANAIFVTDDPRFAESFSGMSEDYMIRELANSIDENPEAKRALLVPLIDTAIKSKDLGTDKNSRGLIKTTREQHIETYMNLPLYRGMNTVGIGDTLREKLRDQLPSRANIIPVYVSAQNPFDYDNPAHIEKLAKQHGGLSDFIRGEINRGSWDTIEADAIQESIRAAGFDGFYVQEGDKKNLAVYDSSQLKSPYNSGAYSAADRRILYRRRKEEPLTTEGQRAAALNERMKNIANEPEPDVDQTFIDRLTLMSEKSKGLPMAIRQAVVDKDAPVKEKLAAAYQNKVTNSLGEIRGDVLNEQAQEATGVADQLMRRGGIRVGADGLYEVYDRVEDGQKISLDGVFEIIIEKLGARLGSDKEAVTLAHRAFIAQRANEINKNNALFESQAEAAEAKGNKQAAAQLRKKIIRVRASQAEIDAGLEAMDTFPELKQAFDTFTKYNEGIIDFLVSTGRLSPAQAKDWKENVGYVPWTRVEEDTNKLESANKLRTGNVHLTELPKLDTAGSSKEIRNVLDNMVGNTIWAIRSGLKNRAAIKTLEQLPDAEELKTQDEVDRELKNNKQLVVFAYRDGERVAFRVQNQEDMAAFSNVVDVAGTALKAFTVAATGLRSFITHMPTFALSQLAQDTGRAMFLSGVKHPFSLPSKVLSNFYHVVTGGATDIQALGITGAYDGMPDHAMRRARERHGLQERNIFLRGWDKLEDFSLAADMAVRAAIYDQTMQETGDRVLAFHRAKEYINFKTTGNGQAVRILRQVVPFMNAYIQGMDVLYRTIQGKGLSMEDRKTAMALFFTTGAKVAALSLLYAALVGDDDDYKGLDDYERDKNFIIPGTGLKLPVAPEIGFLFKVLPERIYQAIAREGTERPVDAKTFMRSMRDSVISAYGGVNLMPQLVKPALEVATNYSFFTNNPIVGINMAGKETYLQFNNSTSELAKALGYLGISPMKADHLLRGYLGTVGGVMLDVTDAVADPERMNKPINKLPLIKTFMYDDTGRGYKSEFYQFREDVDKVVNSVNTFRREGRLEELQEYLTEEKMNLYAMKGVVNKIEDKLGDLRRYRNIIANDSDLTSQEKREKTDEILAIEKELLQAYNIPQLKKMAGY